MGDLRLLDPPENGDPVIPPPPVSEILIPSSVSKRQRRPSVRLGEIGDQPAHDPSHRRSKFSKLLAPSSVGVAAKPSNKSRVTAVTTRRVRTNWPSRLDDGFDAAIELKSSGGEDSRDDEFVEESESPSNRNDRRASARVRVSDGGDEPSEEGFKGWSGGVRPWLEGIGLGRYAPVYEIHEVDDEVLPLLTLEDLKDMGINAVGSRRKMYCAIQKLRKSSDL